MVLYGIFFLMAISFKDSPIRMWPIKMCCSSLVKHSFQIFKNYHQIVHIGHNKMQFLLAAANLIYLFLKNPMIYS